MTNHKEPKLAKEAEISYSSLSMVNDYDYRHKMHSEVSVEIVLDNLRSITNLVNKRLFEKN